MNIALDFDATYTEDPELWNRFIANAKLRGHTVYCVTMRSPSEGGEVEKALAARVDGIFYTSRELKRAFCNRNSIHIDVWIDDTPEFITGTENILGG